MTTVYSGTVNQVTLGRWWWKRRVWMGFCGCSWISHEWRTMPGARAELKQHMHEEHHPEVEGW